MTNKKIYNRIRRTGMWGTLAMFILMFAGTVTLLSAVVSTFANYVFVSKLNEEYDKINYMFKLYDLYSDTDEIEEAIRILDEENRSYIITDAYGRLKYINGIDTRDGYSKTARLQGVAQDLNVFTDTENSDMRPDRRGVLRLSTDSFFKIFFEVVKHWESVAKYTSEVGAREREPGNNLITGFMQGLGINTAGPGTVENRVISRFPIWISIPDTEGQFTLTAKAWFAITYSDFDMFASSDVVGYAVLLILAFLIILFVIGFRDGSRRRRLVGYFLTDPVTGGNNGMWYEIRGGQLLSKWCYQNNDYAIISLAIVNFRNYSISHSKEVGDTLLKTMYDAIVKQLSKKDMCAHFGAGRYVLVLQYDNDTELGNRLWYIIHKLETTQADHKFNFQAGVSKIRLKEEETGAKRFLNWLSARIFGRMEIDLLGEYNNACTARETLTETDGSAIAVFDEKMIEDQKWIDSVREKQQQAVDNEEFLVYYQPKYDPITNELRGAEALIRWESPEFGFVTPNRFIPIFEKNGFITKIDHYMLRHVARDQKKWLDSGYKCVPVSVNISRSHFIENDLAEQIINVVDTENCPRELIELEVTESAFFDDKNAMIETINRLKSYGFAISMDDFGSGYSSLNSLKDMPLDVLKLDGEFFRGKNDDGRGEIVISEAIKLAKNLNMLIVAEGVEIKEQVDFLAGQGCDMIQGYYFAKPMPKNEYTQRLTKDIENQNTQRLTKDIENQIIM